jgi:tetratricopeptide (TPR) repeat protein
MVRHLVYFEALGSMAENTEGWRRIFAGLVVLRLIDIARSGSRAESEVDAATVHSVRSSVLALADTDPVKPILLSTVDAIESGAELTRVCETLMAYGRSLDLDAKWRLAADVLATVTELAPADTHPLAIDANILLGGVARRAGDWDTSAAGYAAAAHAAAVIGDTSRALKAEVGMANTHFEHGNLPAAEQMLEAVVNEAREKDLTGVLELALHDRSSVAYNRGRYADALQYAYDALELAPVGTERDALLGDMGTIFGDIGLRDAARDAHLIVSATSQSQWLVAQAQINLMELAALDGVEEAFDEYAQKLSLATLDARRRAYYLLYLGQGQQRFGRLDSAAKSLEEARSFATKNGINQVAFEAEKALTSAAETWATWPAVSQPATPAEVSDSTLRIARELTQMRELAFATRQ